MNTKDLLWTIFNGFHCKAKVAGLPDVDIDSVDFGFNQYILSIYNSDTKVITTDFVLSGIRFSVIDDTFYATIIDDTDVMKFVDQVAKDKVDYDNDLNNDSPDVQYQQYKDFILTGIYNVIPFILS